MSEQEHETAQLSVSKPQEADTGYDKVTLGHTLPISHQV